jgi:hypothetical protein
MLNQLKEIKAKRCKLKHKYKKMCIDAYCLFLELEIAAINFKLTKKNKSNHNNGIF